MKIRGGCGKDETKGRKGGLSDVETSSLGVSLEAEVLFETGFEAPDLLGGKGEEREKKNGEKGSKKKEGEKRQGEEGGKQRTRKYW